MLPQHWPNPDYCYLESVIGVKPRQLHQMAVSTNPSLSGHVIQLVPPLSDMENYWGFQGYSPFHFYFYQDNWTRIYFEVLNLQKFCDDMSTE